MARYIGLELKGAIVAHGRTAKDVAFAIGRSDANLNRWLNGKTEIPVTVACEVSEELGIELATVVEHAYDRMVMDLGERPNTSPGSRGHLRAVNVSGARDIDLHTVELDAEKLAASTDNTPIDPSRGEG